MGDSGHAAGRWRLRSITLAEVVVAGWHSLKQMRTVLYLFVIIAVAGFIGTLIPQGEMPASYYHRYGKVLGAIVLRLGLDHVYSTGWFLLLLAILVLSLAACTRRLWLQSLERWRVPDAASAARRHRAAASRKVVKAECDPQRAEDLVASVAREKGFRAWRLGENGGARWLHVCRNRWSAWGVALAHYSVFLVAFGALLGVLPMVSVDKYVNIREGEVYRDPSGEIPFAIRVNDFHIKLDPKSGAIENYYSDLSLLEGEQEVVRQTISVNKPLKYRHFYISQSSWGLSSARVEVTTAEGTVTVDFPLQRACEAAGGGSKWVVPQDGAAEFLPGHEVALVAMGFYPDAARIAGKVHGVNAEVPGTPALKLMVVSGFKGGGHDMKDLGWLMKGEEAKIPGGKVKFAGVTEWTGLGVRKDLGVPLVWIGFVGCVVGLIMIFYLPIQWATVKIEPAGHSKSAVSVGFTARREQAVEEVARVWDEVTEEVARRAKAGAAEEVSSNE